MALEFRGRVIAGVKLVGIRGGSGLGFHRLVFDVEFDMNSQGLREELVVTNLSGELQVRGEGGTGDAGRLFPQGPQIVLHPQITPREQMILECSRSRVEAIEELRAGRGLAFTMWLRGSMVEKDGRLQPFAEQVHHEINQSAWLQVLEQIKYMRTLLLEVQLLNDAQAGESAFYQHLKHAHRALMLGNWRESVGCCRDVLESLAKGLGEEADQAVSARVSELLKGSRGWDKSQRFRAVRQAMLAIVSAARHADEVTQAIEWSRSDAQVILTMTATILQRAIGLAQAQEKTE